MTARLIREARELKPCDRLCDSCLSCLDARILCRSLADALERTEKERAAERWWCQDCGHLMAERDRLRAENERLEERVTTLEERSRHEAAENEKLRDVERAARKVNYSLGDLRDQAVLKHALEALHARPGGDPGDFGGRNVPASVPPERGGALR